ncbi:beta strand repeat-containing protein [Lutimaribacter marinistellae]|uniref:Beta strand repeat-containing protein n=1 Tax=Lutimaribacter marinistellae TaxID=1820329 RepID=A0ABV7TLE6_9RHOB
MADYPVTNHYANGTETLTGGSADDRLIFTYTIPDSGVSTGYFAGDLASGYSGVLDGLGSNNVWFAGFQHFTFNTTVTGNENLHTGDGNDILNTGAGDDVINSEGGNDQINGGAGNDIWIADHGDQSSAFSIDLNGFSTFLTTGSVQNIEAMRLTTGNGNDVLTGHASSRMTDNIFAGAGADVITMHIGGDDTVNGSLGSDRLIVTNNLGDDLGGVSTGYWNTGAEDGYSGVFDGSGGNNLWFNNINHFTFVDNSNGNDNIRTGDGNDSLSGGGGNDTLNSGSGSDTVDGGSGTDYWIADHSSAGALDLNLNQSSALPSGGSVVNMEGFNVTTGAGNDTLTGHLDSVMNDVVTTNDGDDLITMRQNGDDTVNGGEGSDRLVVINDLGDGSGGVSTGYWNTGAVDGFSGVFDGYGGNNLWFNNINHFTFVDNSNGNDNIRTGDGNDSLSGGGGNDTLNSGSGSDTVDGGDGNDLWIADHSGLSSALEIDLNGTSALPGLGLVQNVEAFRLQSGSGNDTLSGHESSGMIDIVRANGGDDDIRMAIGGDDSVYGGSGSDRLTVHIGLGEGVSTGYWNSGSTDGYSGVFDGLGGNNLWFNDIDHFTVTDAVGGNDNIVTGAGNDMVSSGAGDDVLNTGSGRDTVDGGEGTDHWIADFADQTSPLSIDLNEVSTLLGTGSVRNMESMDVTGTAGDDLLTGHQTSARRDRLDGGGGNDSFRMWLGGDDSVYGGQGNDVLRVTDALELGDVSFGYLSQDENGFSGVVDGYGGNNLWFYGIESFGFVASGDTDNRFTTGAADDTLDGGLGDDWLNSDGGDDSLMGGAGDDTLLGGNGDDTIEGGSGKDQAIIDSNSGDAAVSVVTGGIQVTSAAGVDLIRNTVETVVFNDMSMSYDELGGQSNNEPNGAVTITGDLVAGETLTADTSTLSDSDGLGVLSYQWLRNGADIAGATGQTHQLTADDVGAAMSVRVSYTDGLGTNETVTSAATDQVASGGLMLTGTPQVDTLTGSSFNDTIDGLAGNDRLIGLEGDDEIDGGVGADTLNGGDGNDTLTGGPDGHEADQRDVIYAGSGDDLAVGGGGNDQMFGQEGNDTLAGGFGADELQGQDGNDVITGGALSDLVFGGAGDDFVNGGFGYDRINGGDGADRFFHLGVADHGSDWVQDYDATEGDVLVFGQAATPDQFQINLAHTATPDGVRSGDASVQEAFVIYRPTGQIMWALVDGEGQESINLQIGGEVFDLLT